MANITDTEKSAFWRQQLKFPPLLTLYAGALGVLVWNGFVGGSTEPTVQLVRAAVPLWALFTICFFIVVHQPRFALKTVGCAGLALSVIALAVTVTELSGH
jgi:hypothetical protein